MNFHWFSAFLKFSIQIHFKISIFKQNTTLAWEVDSPDLTTCFEQTVLVYIPCGFLWLFTLLEIYYMRNSKDKNIPRNFLNSSKIILTAGITILTICDLVFAITYSGPTYPVHFYTPVIKIATFVSITNLISHNNHRKMKWDD